MDLYASKIVTGNKRKGQDMGRFSFLCSSHMSMHAQPDKPVRLNKNSTCPTPQIIYRQEKSPSEQNPLTRN